jgi:prepilin-type N-terminal cleavage/methylation domain-containing protein
MTRAGFTLVEVMVAMAVTGTVLAVGYAALTGTVDTRDRLRAHRDQTERMVRTQSLLRDAIRHVVPADQVDEAPLRLVRGDREGRAADSLILLTRGVDPLLGAGRMWRVVVTADEHGGVLSAVPLLRADEAPTMQPPPLIARMPHVYGVRIEALDRSGSTTWRSDWPDAITAPAALSVQFSTRDAERPLAPLVVRLAGPGIA